MSAREPVPHLEPGGWLSSLALFGTASPPDNTRKLLQRLGRPHDAFETVLVAGTNGKGSTAALLASCLKAAGRDVGLFVSPHLDHVAERICVNGAAIAPAELEALLGDIRPAATELGSTFFEVLTAAAALHFAREGVSLAVMEVGLGGRLDPTNALEPRLALIAKVALDHQAVLGEDLWAIAGEKAGVLRPGGLGLTSADGAALRRLRVEAARVGSELGVLGEVFAERVSESTWAGLELELWFDAGWVAEQRTRLGGVAAAALAPLRPPLRLTTPLVGRHQASNLSLAAAAGLCLGVEPQAIARGAAEVVWPGRLERVEHRGRWVVFDGAHNPHGAAALAEALVELSDGPATLLVAVGRDKDAGAMLRPLVPICQAVVTTEVGAGGRFWDAALLAEQVAAVREGVAGPGSAFAVTEPREAFYRALELTETGGTLVVAGSLHLVGELRPLVLGSGGA